MIFDKIFNSFRKKAALEAPLIYGSRHYRAVYPEHNIDALIKEGYQKNAVVFKCIEDISRAVSSVPVYVKIDGKDASDSHPLYKLLARPNPATAREPMIKELATWLLATGNTYIEAVTPGKIPAELWVKKSHKVRVKPGRNMVAAYEYNAAFGGVEWPVDQVTGRCDLLHIKSTSLTDDFYGMSPLTAAAINVDQMNEIDVWNYSMLNRGPSFRGVFTSSGSDLTAGDITLIREQLESRKYSGARSGGNIPIMPAGLAYQSTELNPSDMAIIEAKDMTARFICFAFGYPSLLLGLSIGSTFNNVKEAREYLWDNTVIPITDSIYSELSQWMQQWFPGVKICPDYDQVPALQQKRMDSLTALDKVSFLSVNEKREASGYDKVANGDDIYVSAGVMPVGESGYDEPGEKSEPDGYDGWINDNQRHIQCKD